MARRAIATRLRTFALALLPAILVIAAAAPRIRY
jgi:hypothetical protein